MIEVKKDLLNKLKYMKLDMKKKSLSQLVSVLYNFYIDKHKTMKKQQGYKSSTEQYNNSLIAINKVEITDEDWKEIQRIKDKRKKVYGNKNH